MEEADKTEEKQRKDYLFKPGQSGNPKGRPKGSISIKDKVRQYLEGHPEEVEAIVEHFVKTNRELMWQMLEGRPAQDVTSGGDKINPIPIYGGLSTGNSDQKDIQPEKEN
jgi:hypothetical protein